MIWLWALVSILIIGGIAVVATGRWGSMSEVYEDRPDVVIPAATLSGQRIKDVRFSHSIRGYRQDEVDTLLDLVAAELDRREEMLRQANIPLEPSTIDGSAAGRRRAEPSRSDDTDKSADRRTSTQGYPWDDDGGSAGARDRRT